MLKTLAAHGLMPAESVEALLAAYRFLRNLEHRLQYLDDAQTQTLPADADCQALIAQAMNFNSWDALLEELGRQRSRVTQHFKQVFAAPQTDQSTYPLQAVWRNPAEHESTLAELGYRRAAESATRLAQLRELSLLRGGRTRNAGGRCLALPFLILFLWFFGVNSWDYVSVPLSGISSSNVLLHF